MLYIPDLLMINELGDRANMLQYPSINSLISVAFNEDPTVNVSGWKKR